VWIVQSHRIAGVARNVLRAAHVRNFILVVDDDADIRDAVNDLLVMNGYHVIAVENGEQALGALAVAVPALVLTDVAMPVRDGLQLASLIRESPRLRTVPICFLTAAPSAALPCGFAAIRTPFDADELLEVVRHRVDPIVCLPK
jgi:two-component system, chemotaxis family, chemotaxis protein CheY